MELMNASSSCASAIGQGGGGSTSTAGSVPSAGGSGAIGSSAGAARGATAAGPGGTAGTAWATACIGTAAATVARAINRKRLNIITSGIPAVRWVLRDTAAITCPAATIHGMNEPLQRRCDSQRPAVALQIKL